MERLHFHLLENNEFRVRAQVRNNTRRRAKNLGETEIRAVVEMLDGWTGSLTWDGLIEQIVLRLQSRYTRQALHRHERIRMAFAARKGQETGMLEPATRGRSKELQIAIDRVARLEAENDRLTRENNALLEQFVRWAYNAHTRGLTEDFLNKPLMPVQR